MKVYNFEVEELHNYYVGTQGILVHNKCASGNAGGKLAGGSYGINSLYHYTNENGMNGIVESNQLKPSLKANNPKDARYGNGQYLSDINRIQ